MEKGEAEWTYDEDAGAWYLALKDRAKPPYLKQIHAEAIIDLDSEGRLVGIEILEHLIPSRGENE